jgi:uncharacterized protein (DUF2141 family)
MLSNMILLLFIIPFLPSTAPNGTLTVTILNFKNNLGQVSIALYNREEAFPKSPDKAVKILRAPIRDKKSIVVFESLPPGEYAISVYHDENNNGKMDTNFFGIPKEGVGASNDARGHLGPPHYKDAKFNFTGGVQSISIHMIYL